MPDMRSNVASERFKLVFSFPGLFRETISNNIINVKRGKKSNDRNQMEMIINQAHISARLCLGKLKPSLRQMTKPAIPLSQCKKQ
mmetsp:Transcript_17481/g.25844  ORF Transcript_17481/g.25844 Transcript_17481/m.25844 type:complete len:85 (-) Transcript_17481:162-416(-)